MANRQEPSRRTGNPKRKMVSLEERETRREEFCRYSRAVQYDGNPEHKRNPGNFKLIPPAAAKPGKTLCDVAEIFLKSEAENLLRQGLEKGLVSVQMKDGWPKHIWAVAPNGVPLEAKQSATGPGVYHGYPLGEEDAFSKQIKARWKE